MRGSWPQKASWLVGAWLSVASLSACLGQVSDAGPDAGGSGGAVIGNPSPTGGSTETPGSGGNGNVVPPPGTGGVASAAGGAPPSSAGSGGSAPSTPTCDYPQWQAGMEYQAGDRVLFNGQAYEAEHDNPGYDPVISHYFWEPVDCQAPMGTAGSAGMGAGGTASYPEGCALDRVMGSTEWYSIYSRRRDAFYTYEALCTALERFPAFANSGNLDVDKREAAAFFANVSRETGELDYIEQIVKDPPRYFGRGPMQLTHDYNYRAAGEYLGIDLLGDPDQVARDPVVTWQVALWFWMVYEFNGNCHNAITNDMDFGRTIRVINGGFECNGPNQAAQQRIAYYQEYTTRLGVDPGNKLTCW